MKNTKIFISYHDEHPLIQSDILTPIQTGCADAPKLFEGMLRDDTGDNISQHNRKYCELTAQYWVWKNYDKIGNPDYVGFMHYRRHFMFDGWHGRDDFVWLPKGAVYFVPFMSKDYQQTHLSDKLIMDTMKDCDCLVIKPYDVKHLSSHNCRTQYGKLPKQDTKYFDILVQTARKLFPEYSQAINRLAQGSVQYLCNMFVMNKALFLEYNNFCFTILQAVDKQIDSSSMDDQTARFLGYFGEFLLSVFIFQLQLRHGIRIKEVNASYILNDKPLKLSYIKYIKYWILYKLLWGKPRQKYKQKFKELKHLKKLYI